MKDNIIFQDSQSTILMLKNGRNSCTSNSRHINIRYFFIKDRIDKKEARVEYCLTEITLADFFTKALQCRLFLLFGSVIMGYQPISILNNPHLWSRSVLELWSKSFWSNIERIRTVEGQSMKKHNVVILYIISTYVKYQERRGRSGNKCRL